MPGRRRTSAAKAAVVEPKKDRRPVPLFPELEAETWEEPAKPGWIAANDLASKAWDEKVARYKLRSQRVRGFEDALAQYCALEASLVQAYVNGLVPNVSTVREHRAYAHTFFDTPSSQQVAVKPNARSTNPFARIAAMG